MAAAGVSPPANQDINVTFEDQQKINRFARLNARMEEIKEELKQKQLVMQNMDDALNEIQVAELEGDDESEGIRLMEGEVFVQFSLSDATTWVEKKKAGAEQECASLDRSIAAIKEEMTQLKTALYAKFGRENINLEADE